jgi:Flp pilus assembly protein TadD
MRDDAAASGFETTFVEQVARLRDGFKAGQVALYQAALLPREEIEAGYASAMRMLAIRKDQDAANVFASLTLFDPYDVRFWRGLGLALQRSGRSRLAMRAHQAALCLDSQDLPALVYRAEAYLLEQDIDRARADLLAVIARATQARPDDAPFVTRANELLRFVGQVDAGVTATARPKAVEKT